MKKAEKDFELANRIIERQDDPPTPSSFAEATEDKWIRRAGTTEAIKRRAAEKKASDEKKGKGIVAKTSQDPFGELSEAQKTPGLKQRFPDRVLVMTTDRCFSRCAHCTRRWILGRTPTVGTPADLARCVEYVRRHPQVRDVLLSGGDVLTLPDSRVAALVDAFAALPQVEVIRICTRAPVSRPSRVTDRLARLLARSGKVWANVHINTASEAAAARGAAARLVTHGIPVSSPTVLLKGVNDTPRKMMALLRALSAARIRPYYVFMCDPVSGLERFRVPLERAKGIERYCAARIGGLALPRFVADLPGAERKIPIDLL